MVIGALFLLDFLDREISPKKKESKRIVNLDKFWSKKPVNIFKGVNY